MENSEQNDRVIMATGEAEKLQAISAMLYYYVDNEILPTSDVEKSKYNNVLSTISVMTDLTTELIDIIVEISL